MPKNKTHKGLAKRVKVTARRKVKRRQAFTGHLLSSRTSKQRRRLRRGITMNKADTKKVLEKLGA